MNEYYYPSKSVNPQQKRAKETIAEEKARKIKELKEKINKGEVTSDKLLEIYQEITKLAKEIEELFSNFTPEEVIESIEEIKRKKS